jgi:TolA-binding protein
MAGTAFRPGFSQEGTMKKHPRLWALGLCLLAGCTPTQATRIVQREETRGNGRTVAEQTTTEVSAAEKVAYQKEMQQHLDDLNKEMARWREKLDKAAATAKEEMQVQLKNLEKQREAAAERLRELGKSSGPAWAEMKEGFRRAYEDLKSAAQKAREKFR